MSMTIEEAIKQIEKLKSYCEYMADSDESGAYLFDLDGQALDLALSALRPITREQAEKMRGKFFQAGIDDVAQDTWRCSRCLVQEFGNIQGINFCPSCGAPMTDKAVDMVMERLEARHEET